MDLITYALLKKISETGTVDYTKVEEIVKEVLPDWAETSTKPTYTAAEVGALPDTYKAPVISVNGKTGAINLTASNVGALPDTTTIPSKAADVEADPAGTASSMVSTHNSNSSAHSDIRQLIAQLQTLVNAITVPTKVSELENDKGYLTSESDPSISTSLATKQDKILTSDDGSQWTISVADDGTLSAVPYTEEA